jgi:hypothetical protein
MLAYVFWHWRRPDVPAADYEERQRAFHRALADAPPMGFEQSSCHAVVGAPWAAQGADAYEDRYLVTDSAALDALNAGAVSASRSAPHDAAAAAAAGGTAGLYTLQSGTMLDDARVAYCFAKPAGMRYAGLFALLETLTTARRTTLWMRYMTLGPAPEFCLQATEQIALPASIAARRLELRPVFTGSARPDRR